MLTVHKLPLERTMTQQLRLPLNSTILSLKVQRNVPVVYYHCDDKEERFTDRFVCAAPTGAKAGTLNSFDYLGTAMLDDGELVLHFFVSK